MKLKDISQNYLSSAIHKHLTATNKEEIVTAVRAVPTFLDNVELTKKEALDGKLVAFTVLALAKNVLRTATNKPSPMVYN